MNASPFTIAAALAIFASALPVSRAAADPWNPCEAGVLDPSGFSQWVDGTLSPVPASAAKNGPASVVWTTAGRPEWSGVKFGEGRAPGIRHLRIGFKPETTVGSAIVRGGGTLSFLKPGTVGAADPGNDALWQPAERIYNSQPSHAEVGPEDYAVWVFPAGTRTGALRFSHTPSPGDRENAGWLGGLWIQPARIANVAPQALAQSTARDDSSARLIDESHNHQWQTWDNGEKGAPQPVSQDRPEVFHLTWPATVTLSGVGFLWTGFSAVEIDAFAGDDHTPAREAAAHAWKPVARRDDMDALYPMGLGPNWLGFEKPVTTRALRFRILKGARSNHPHLADKVKDGRRVWLGELMAFSPLADDRPLASAVLPRATDEPPPIPIRFHLPEAGVVTLVVDDGSGKRVRNLISEQPFPAGDNTAWWDGGDDLARDPEAARHGVYHVPSRPAAPGNYRIRGLSHRPLRLRYEFSIYNAGRPAWETADKTGCWLTTHTPPTSVAVVPGSKTTDGQPLVFMGAFVTEGGHGLQWLREDGTKLGGQGWVGGNWTGAPTLTVDHGPNAIADHLCYVGSIWEGELRLTAKKRDFSDHPVARLHLLPEPDPKGKATAAPAPLTGFDGGEKINVLGGIAAHNGTVVAALTRQSQLLVIDARTGNITARIDLASPRGLTFSPDGQLFALSGQRLMRFRSLDLPPTAVIATGLDDPRHVALDASASLFITDRGTSHQVKVFDPAGRPRRTVGKPGTPAVGPYDPLHLSNPNGIAVDSQGRLWVAEADNHPRRVSLWSEKGDLLRAFYGPTEYGGGGVLDPVDPSRFFYKGLEFHLNWENGSDSLTRVFYRPNPLLEAHFGPFSPDWPLHPENSPGPLYFTSCYTHNPTNGDDVAFLWRDDGREARLVAGIGDAHAWPVLQDPAFLPSWPQGTRPAASHPQADERAAFAWSDANADGVPQPAEITWRRVPCHGVTVMNDLSAVVARLGQQSARFAATIAPSGVPAYNLSAPDILGPAGGTPPSSGGNQALVSHDGWTVFSNAPSPLSPHGPGGFLHGQFLWSYPSPWPGLHASHEAAVPDRPGMIVGHTRLLGGPVTSAAGPLFALNGNMGNMYLMTVDGLFVSTLFHDIRLRPAWAAPVATRGMDVTDVSLHDENFWPSLTRTADGSYFLVDGARTSLVRIDGLDSLKRLPDSAVTVTPEDLAKAREWQARAEARRQALRGTETLDVPRGRTAPTIDGSLDDWAADTAWAPIDRRGIKANFNSDSKPFDVSAAVRLNDTHLFAAWRTTEKDLLNNTGDADLALFKTGGALDLMLGTDPSAAPNRREPVVGDLRLVVTLVKKQPRALLYRARVPATTQPVKFSSPWRSVPFDKVEDVTPAVQWATDGNGNHEIAIPLAILGWNPEIGATYRADLGVLRGSDGHTTQRVYWNNKATAITADVPSEAELTPSLWGKWRIVGP